MKRFHNLTGLMMVYASGLLAGLAMAHAVPSWVTPPNMILSCVGAFLASKRS
jgi:hypothetical protein